MDSHYDPVLQQKIFAIRTLLSNIERGVWFPDYFELRFGGTFDASFLVITDDVGRQRSRIGNPHDILVIHALGLFFCTVLDAEGREVASGKVAAFQRKHFESYNRVTSGKNWMRFWIPTKAERLFLHATRRGADGAPYQVGQWFLRPI